MDLLNIAICPASEKETSFEKIASIAKDNFWGIALYKDQKWQGNRPEATLSYGNAWAFV